MAEDNKFIDIGSLVDAEWEGLTWLSLDYDTNTFQSDDVRWTMKMGNKKLTYICKCSIIESHKKLAKNKRVKTSLMHVEKVEKLRKYHNILIR